MLRFCWVRGEGALNYVLVKPPFFQPDSSLDDPLNPKP